MAYGPLRQALSGPYVLQDDFRQHIFWMERFVDPDLFPGDLIADYFQAVAPTGYTIFYRASAAIGIDPLLLAKLLPMPLGLVTTLLCFVLSMQLLPVPSSAFISTTLLGQALWATDSIVSATPRAFMYPILLLFLCCLVAGSRVLCLVSIALMCLFYPPIVPIMPVVIALNLVQWDSKRIRLSRDLRDYVFCAAAIAIAPAILLPFVNKIAWFGPVVSAAEGQTMPEFLPGGRIVVFREGLVNYWITGKHSGMFASSPLRSVGFALAFLLPLLWLNRDRFSLADRLSRKIGIFPRLILASLIMFFAAHLMLFELYLPSRFTAHSFRIILAVCAGVCGILILEAVVDAAVRSSRPRSAAVAVCSVSVLLLSVVFYPQISGSLPIEKYKIGKYAELYEFLSRQPNSIVIASLSRKADDLPVFSRRSVLISREAALPYHKRYYGELRQRAIDLINATYSSSFAELQNFVREREVSFLLLDKEAFAPDHLAKDSWLMQFQPATREAITKLANGDVPVLKRLLDRYTVLETDDLVLLDANLILTSASAIQQPSDCSATRLQFGRSNAPGAIPLSTNGRYFADADSRDRGTGVPFTFKWSQNQSYGRAVPGSEKRFDIFAGFPVRSVRDSSSGLLIDQVYGPP
jgi:hypothetical protein